MAFTYSDALTQDRDKIRLNIGDTKELVGPRPDKSNFSDSEIAYALSKEGNVTAATAFLFETLSAEWESYSISEKRGTKTYDAKGKAVDFQNKADNWRAKPGGAPESGKSIGLVTLTRQDAYSD